MHMSDTIKGVYKIDIIDSVLLNMVIVVFPLTYFGFLGVVSSVNVNN